MTDEDFKIVADSIPKDPGVYRFMNEEGVVIYVGKAKNLRKKPKPLAGRVVATSFIQYRRTVGFGGSYEIKIFSSRSSLVFLLMEPIAGINN